jgi:hypothetical protein
MVVRKQPGKDKSDNSQQRNSAPFHASRVLAIDPFRQLSVTIKNDYMSLYPQELGRSFVHTGESCRESLFDSVVRKFGHDRAYGLLDEWRGWGEVALDTCVPMFVL